MSKRVALLVRERQREALRVAAGLTLDDNLVEAFVLDCALEQSPESVAYLELLLDAGARVSTNCADNTGLELVSNAELARRILGCDHILAY